MKPLEQILGQLASALAYEDLPDELSQRAGTLQARLRERQLHLAVLGQFKRGKSTLINALLGDPLLPDGVLPVTAVPIFLYAGPEPHLEIYRGSSQNPESHAISALPDFVTEQGNPQNRKDVSRVNLYYPAPLLQKSIILIDTPGIGSIHENNTETTLRFLPRCDAAILVFSADPPITATEVEFIRALQPHIAHAFFVLNKVDYLAPEEVTRAVQFLQDALKDVLNFQTQEVFALSARQGLAARQKDDADAWKASGVERFAAHLAAFAEGQQGAVLAQAIRQKACALIDEAGHLLALRREAMQLPLRELDQKIAAFQDYAGAARRQREEIEDRLAGDEKRLNRRIETTAAALRQRAAKALNKQIAELELSLPREEWVAQAKAITADFFDQTRETWRQEIGEELEATLSDRAREILALREQLRHDAADLLHIAHVPLVEDDILIELSEPVWVSGTFVPLPQESSFGERLLPAQWQRQRQMQRRQELVEEFVSRNTERVRWWLLQMVQESIRQFRRRLAEMLEQTIQQIEDALQNARRHQQTGKASQEKSLAMLDARRKELAGLRRALARSTDDLRHKLQKEHDA